MISAPGQANVPTDQIVLKNLSGGVTEQYGVYALDFLKANGATVTVADQLTNLVLPAAGHLATRGRFFIAQAGNIPNGNTLQALGFGIATCKVSGTVVLGDQLIVSPGNNYLVSKVPGNTNTACAQALAANASGTVYMSVDFFGSPH